MKNNVSNETFMEWTEQYLNDTIQPEAARQLLQLLQNDPDRLEQFCNQLQMEHVLKVQQQADTAVPIADAVLQRIREKAEPKIIRPVQWNRILLRTAAVLAVVLGIGTVMKSSLNQKSGDAVPESEGVSPTTAPSPTAIPKMVLKKPAIPDMVKRPSSKLISQSESAEPMPEMVAENALDAALAKMDSSISVAPAPSTTRVEYSIGGLGFATPTLDLYGSSGRNERSLPVPEYSTESYAAIEENRWLDAADKPLSTFSIDVDTASYANVRRFLNSGQLPPRDAVRVEEMINYFEYDYAPPTGSAPFSTAMALTTCPWNRQHRLLRVGLQGRRPDDGVDKPANLVFLLDVSGSMNSPDKLPLLKKGFTMMVNALGEKDRVAIVAYAGSSGLVLDSTSAANKEKIIRAMDRLTAGGSTAGGAGIELAYRLATDHFIQGGINRVILATDGDFNVGISNLNDLQKLIEAKRETGVFLSVLGFGSGNLKDSSMELLANKGNGNYFYIDSEREADKVLVKQLTANMVTIAKDVKIQIEFNPAIVRSYRLIGYENRVMAAKDFDDDRKDAGEIGAGHQVTALYELVLTDAPAAQDGVALKYAQPSEKRYADHDEMLTLKLRYKEPEGDASKLLSFPLKVAASTESMDGSFRWATAVAAFGQYLRQSDNINRCSLEEIEELAQSAIGKDPYGYRQEFIRLLQQARQLETRTSAESNYPQWQYRN